MNLKAIILGIFFLVVLSDASVIPTVKVLQGPSSKTVLLGPDGGAIDSSAPGGTVLTDDHGSGLVAAGQAVLPLGPDIVVNGPAGSILTSYTNAGPAIVRGVTPGLVPGAIAPSAAVIAGPGVEALGDDNGHEGAYVPDNVGGLYDDGAYRGEHW